MRILWVVPRFGAEIVGGAETLARALAHRGGDGGWSSEIATTCAVDHATWENVLPAGETSDGDLLVRRFPIGPRDPARFWDVHQSIVSGTATYTQELDWLSNSGWSQGLQQFLERNAADYDLLLFAPYTVGTTIWGAQVAPERSALMPCLHDEPYAYLETVRRLFASTRGFLFNTEAERRLAARLYGGTNGYVVGMGFDERPEADPLSFATSRGIGPYLLYAGRLEEGKRVHVAVEYAVRYARESNSAPLLVLVGEGQYAVPADAAPFVLRVGYLDEVEKRTALAGAIALVNPSEMESLSLTLLESWFERTPAIVASGSQVMHDHCDDSGAGFTFATYEDYCSAVDRLRSEEDLRVEMGAAGRAYVLGKYGWPAVRERFQAAVIGLAR